MNQEKLTSNLKLTQNELDEQLNAIQSIEDIVACYEKIEKLREGLRKDICLNGSSKLIMAL